MPEVKEDDGGRERKGTATIRRGYTGTEGYIGGLDERD